MRRILCLAFVGVFVSWQPAAAQTAAPWIERGTNLEARGLYTEAVKAYTKAIALDPGSTEAYLKRGTARFSAKKTDGTEALGDLTEAIRLSPQNAEAYYRRGIVNYYLINNEQGRKDMKAAAALGHTGAIAWFSKKENRGTDAADDDVLQARPVLYFHHDRADINAPSRTLLEAIGPVLFERSSRSSIMVSGHADSTGTDEYNQALSLRRATAVKGYLMEHAKIPSEKIVVRAYGAGMPVASNSTDEGRAANRRVEIASGTAANNVSER